MASTNGQSPGVVYDQAALTLQNAAGANGNGTALVLTPRDREISLSVVGSTAVLTLGFSVSFDGGASYVNAFAEDLLSAAGIGTLVNSIVNPGTGRYRYRIPPGATHFRAPVSGFVSGTVTVTAVVRSST